MTVTKKIITNVLIYTTLFYTFFVIVVVGYWSLFPYRTLEFKDEFFPIHNKVIEQGGYFQYVSNYCKYISLPASVSRTFVDGIIYTTPATTTDRAVGCHSILVGVNVPRELPPGLYHMEVIYQYKVNPIRTITVKHPSEQFTIVEK